MAEEQTKQKKQWVMNAFAMAVPCHLAPGLWKLPEDRSKDYNTLEYWTDLAKILEEGKFHGIFLADVLGPYDVYGGPRNLVNPCKSGAQYPLLDPFMIISAMASVTKKLSFGITASTTYESPYALARRYSSLDHLTKGRVGWNIVTSYLDSAARGFGLTEQIDHDTRYKMAEEFLDVFYKLVEGSWADDAVTKDIEKGEFINPEKVKYIDHVGEFYRCGGPNTLPPSPQRTPYIFQAGASKTGQAFATAHSEAMFLPGLTPEQVQKTVQSVRDLAESQGRARNSIKCLSGVCIILGETDEEAQAKYQRYIEASDLDGVGALFGGWTGADLAKFSDDQDFAFSGPGAIQSMVSAWSKTIPNSGGVKWTKRRLLQEIAVGGFHPKIIGSPKTVADELERWVEVGDIDGFNLSYAVSPGSFEDLVKLLWPELKKRGVLWDDYAAETARENYSADGKGPRVREDHPAARYTWKAGQASPPEIVLKNKEVKNEEEAKSEA